MWYFRSFAWILPLKRARGEIDYAIGGPPAITDLFREEKKENLYDRTVSFLNIPHAWNPASILVTPPVVCVFCSDGSDNVAHLYFCYEHTWKF